jgi:hypothetical protein
MTTFLSNEKPEFLGPSSFMPDVAVSSIVDNIILLSLVEINSTLRGCLTVLKAPGITEDGPIFGAMHSRAMENG